jgi:DNA invertase Pin-like site-specific DNA recombinase
MTFMTTHNPAAALPGIPSKITTAHLARLACIYVRQSSWKQVEQHRESQLYQAQLAERAQAFGWSPERIRIIDTDLGFSGRERTARTGFNELLAELSLGHVGIIFGYEVSRLARNNQDWYHVLDLAAVFGTLIADNDGLYDPRLYNDRLLLGLKGTMSEAELHLLRQRLDAGRLSAVRRGAYRQRLPTGLVRLPDGTPDGNVVQDPDDQVRHSLELVFSQFAALGSCQKVLRYLRAHELLLPRHQRSGPGNGRVVWKIPSASALLEILQNPAYAGAFAYGRKQTDPTRRQPGYRATGISHRPQSEWIHLQLGVYPAYISWEQYQANQERLHQNAMRFHEKAGPSGPSGPPGPQGAVREGAALLQGVISCGLCGHRMALRYRETHRYTCDALARHFQEPICASLPGPAIDAVVSEAFLTALQPAQLDILDAVLREQQSEHLRLERQWQEQLKRAEYEAQLAARQYEAVDPTNRLVAAELERRWEEKLQAVQTTRQGYERFAQAEQPHQLTAQQRQQFAHLSETLPAMWHNGQLSAAQQKELLRCLIQRVIAARTDSDSIAIKIVWVSGHYSEASIRPPIWRECDVRGYEQMIGRVQELWTAGRSDEQIAALLTGEGYRSARSSGVIPKTVQKIRLRHGWYSRLHQSRKATTLDGYLTAEGLAARLGVGRTWVYRRLAAGAGAIDPQYVTRHVQGQVYLIRDDPELIASLAAVVGGRGRRTDTAAQRTNGASTAVSLCHIAKDEVAECDE